MSPFTQPRPYETDEHRFTQGPEAIRSVIEAPDRLGEDVLYRKMVEELTQRADRLAAKNAWTRDEFLESAGCSSADLVISGEATRDFLLACISYLMWVESAVDALDVQLDRRMAVLNCDGLFRESKRDLELCRTAMSCDMGSDQITAEEFLALGEVARAFQVARARMGALSGRVSWDVFLTDSLFASAPHVSEERVALVWTSPEALGLKVAEKIREHVLQCVSCGDTHTRVFGRR